MSENKSGKCGEGMKGKSEFAEVKRENEKLVQEEDQKLGKGEWEEEKEEDDIM